MAKIPVKIDEDIMDFIKSDAAKDYRSVAGQVNALLDLCRQAGGYRELLKAINAVDLQKEQLSSRTETRGRKRTRPQEIKWHTNGGCDCAVILHNVDDDKALVVKTNDFTNDVKSVISQLKSGKFPVAEVQADYSDKCCKFEVLSGFGDTIEEVRSNCDVSEFYEDMYDCGGGDIPEEFGRTEAVPQAANSTSNVPALADVLAIPWDTMSHQQTLRQYMTICKNPEVREIAEAYIDEQFAPEDEVVPETIFAEDAAIIMDRFRRKYRK